MSPYVFFSITISWLASVVLLCAFTTRHLFRKVKAKYPDVRLFDFLIFYNLPFQSVSRDKREFPWGWWRSPKTREDFVVYYKNLNVVISFIWVLSTFILTAIALTIADWLQH